jgi:hypothetical protein
LDVTRPKRPGSVCTQPYIECVFEDHLAELDAARTLTAAEANEHTLITAETRRLQIAAHWADLHPGEAVAANRLPGTQRPVRLGGEGTPTIGDFAAAELGCALRMSAGSASRLIGDALDLRHRLRLTCAVAQGRAGAGLLGPTHRHRDSTSQLRADSLGRSTARPNTWGSAVEPVANPAGGGHL